MVLDDPTSLHCEGLKKPNRFPLMEIIHPTVFLFPFYMSVFPHLYCLWGEKENIKCLILGEGE